MHEYYHKGLTWPKYFSIIAFGCSRMLLRYACTVTVIRMIWISSERRVFFHVQVHGKEENVNIPWGGLTLIVLVLVHRTAVHCSCFCHHSLVLSTVLTKDVCGCCWRHDELEGSSYYTKTRYSTMVRSKRERERGDIAMMAQKNYSTRPALSQSSMNSGCLKNDFGSNSQSASSLFLLVFYWTVVVSNQSSASQSNLNCIRMNIW